MSAHEKKVERRKARRRPILDTFSLFVVVPKKGDHRLRVHDLSDQGVGFDIDTEGEVAADSPVDRGEEFGLRLYLNQSLSIPLMVKVVRIDDTGVVRKIGAVYVGSKESKGMQALQAFVHLLDTLLEAAEIK